MWLFDEVADKMQGSLTLGAGVSTLSLWGVPLHDWVYIVTLIILVLQLVKVTISGIIKLRDKVWKKKT